MLGLFKEDAPLQEGNKSSKRLKAEEAESGVVKRNNSEGAAGEGSDRLATRERSVTEPSPITYAESSFPFSNGTATGGDQAERLPNPTK